MLQRLGGGVLALVHRCPLERERALACKRLEEYPLLLGDLVRHGEGELERSERRA